MKQNAPLRTIFGQMKELMDDLKIVLPNEEYCYFGFVNNTEPLKESEEKILINDIKQYEEENGNFKIFLFILQNNKIFDLELKENIEYALHFRNEINKKLAEMKNEIDVKLTEMDAKINRIIELINEIKVNKNTKEANKDKPD